MTAPCGILIDVNVANTDEAKDRRPELDPSFE
jgi:hypothetical protein